MRHRFGQRKLGRPTGHRLSLIRNLMTDLIRHERLQTTEPKAAELRREVEKLIGTARANDLHARRLVAARLYDEEVARKLFAEIVPRFADRPGGFTRTTRLAPRRGDGAPMAQIELVR
jgi:large subunit ribosomal protein L17